jgi:hypothetical protein
MLNLGLKHSNLHCATAKHLYDQWLADAAPYVSMDTPITSVSETWQDLMNHMATCEECASQARHENFPRQHRRM